MLRYLSFIALAISIFGGWTILIILVVAAIILVLVVGISGSSEATETTGSNIPSEYIAVVIEAGTICDAITPSLIAAQIQQESGWDPDAQSSAGAQGISQFMPSTWASVGIDHNNDGVANVWDPQDAIYSQGSYMCSLAEQVQEYLDSGQINGELTQLTLAAYNAGIGNVLSYAGVPSFEETQNYVTNILTLETSYQWLNNYATTGSTNSDFLSVALAQVGKDYVWGSTGPNSFDCSGLVVYAAGQTGLTVVGRTVEQMYANSISSVAGENFTSSTNQIRLADNSLRSPGDVILFYNSSSGWYHAAIYMGTVDGSEKIVHANTPSTGVIISNLSDFAGDTWAVIRLQ